jgi:hypothetical protein
MKIQTLEELTTPNDPALRFTPYGFAMHGRMKPQAAAEHIQRTLWVELSDKVADSTKQSFEAVRQTHTYGLFGYDLFTIAGDHSLLVLEQAFGERFNDYYGGVIPLVDRQRTEVPLRVRTFTEVYDAIRGGTHKKMRSVRSIAHPGSIVPFDASFSQLFSWARHEGLLHGQRSRLLDKVFVRMRNLAAHPRSFHRSGPPDAAKLICDVAEIINRLWGSLTPGGRLYAAPIRREIFAICWSPDGTQIGRPWAANLQNEVERNDWRFILVRAVEADDVWGFQADFETTQYPCELLWGPGTANEAIRWLAQAAPAPDETEYMDRWFAVRTSSPEPEPPRNLDQFAGLPESEQPGEWLLIKADYPLDAYAHARSITQPVTACSRSGECDRCGVYHRASGDWPSIRQVVESLGINVVPKTPTGVRVDSEIGRWPYP